MTPLRATRDDLMRAGYQAPVRHSIIDPHLPLGCPRLVLLGWSFLCGMLFLMGFPLISDLLGIPFDGWSAAAISGGVWVVGVVLMIAVTRLDAQWLEVAAKALMRSGRLEV
jgi:type IV secretory pathway TrbD component